MIDDRTLKYLKESYEQMELVEGLSDYFKGTASQIVDAFKSLDIPTATEAFLKKAASEGIDNKQANYFNEMAEMLTKSSPEFSSKDVYDVIGGKWESIKQLMNIVQEAALLDLETGEVNQAGGAGGHENGAEPNFNTEPLTASLYIPIIAKIAEEKHQGVWVDKDQFKDFLKLVEQEYEKSQAEIKKQQNPETDLL